MVHAGRRIPNRLRKYRKVAGYNQQDVAWFLGHANTSRLSRWENGLSRPSAMNLMKLSILYGVLQDELYYEAYIEFKKGISEKEEIHKQSRG